jgi:hypothetical protein
MERIDRPRRRLAALVLAAAASLAGCASSEAYRYDDGDAYARQGYAPGGAAQAERAGDYEESVATTAMAPAPADASLFDAIGGLVAGAAGEGAKRAEAPPPPASPPPPKPSPVEPGPTQAPSTTDAPKQQASKRLMIYRASYGLLVSNVEESIDKFLRVVADQGGYLEQRSGDAVSVRVPAAAFQGLVDALPTYGRVTSQNVAAQDVTKAFMDLSIRIENAEASRKRLLELLKQATKMEDILSIEREVRRLSEEIETMKGELRFLSDQIAFSTITVQFQSNAPPPIAWPQQRRSRFEWVNQVGLERVIRDF